MRESGWISYEERFDAVAAHVSEHLGEPLDLIRLAEVAGLSPKHWHRVYTSAFGETLASFVKRLRLQHAAFSLANTTEPVAQVAASCGYPNVSSFTRAFTGAYGMPPARYRTSGAHSVFQDARTALDPEAFEVEIRLEPPVPCLTVEHIGPYERINEAFRDLEVWYAAHGYGYETHPLLGVFLSDPTLAPASELRSLACLPRPPGFTGPPSPLAEGAAQILEHTISGGRYAVLSHVGPYAAMPAKYGWFFGCWVPTSGQQLAELPVVERYLDDPRVTAPADLTTEMWLPLAEHPRSQRTVEAHRADTP